MPKLVRAYSSDDGNTLVTVSEVFAKSAGLHTVKDDPTDAHGRPLPPSEGYRTTKTSATPATNTTGGSSASKPEEASK